MPQPFTFELRVRYVECDMQGHVFNAHYLTWFDMAHTELLQQALGRPWLEVVASGVDLVVAESGVTYLAPARFDELVIVSVTLDPPTTTSLTSRFHVRRDDRALAEGFLRHVCVATATTAKQPWPDEIRTALMPYVLDGPG